MADPERILIVRLSHLGDVVCGLGLFHALHTAYPAARIAWAVQPEFAELLHGLPGLDATIPFGRRDGWRAWPRVFRQLRRFGPDLAVDAQGNLKSALVTLCSGARRRTGLARTDWREPAGAIVLNERAVACPPAERHVMHRTQALTRHLVPDAMLPLRTDPGLTSAERARGGEILDELLPGRERPILIHLSSTKDVRAWTLAGWKELIEALLQAGRACLVISGPGELQEGRDLARRLPAGGGLAQWTGQAGLRELAAVFAVAGERGASLVSADSGPMHIAWSVGLPVVVLEGPQDAARTGPWPPAGRDSRTSGEHVEIRSRTPPPCAPCLSPRCTHAEGPVCMESIRAREIVRALDAVSDID